MTELKLGKLHIRSYSNPTCWKLFKYKKATKSGRIHEVLLGWLGTLPQALNRALEQHVADADAESVAEVLEAIEEFSRMVEEVLSEG